MNARFFIVFSFGAALAVVAVGVASWAYTVDDAFIVARFAQNLVRGQGYAMNPGEPADGLTGPLWIAPGAIAVLLGGDPVRWAKGAGLACAAAAAWLSVRSLLHRQRGRRASAYAALLIASSPALGTWGAAGLETGAAALLCTVAFVAAQRRPQPSVAEVGLSLGALAWLRPELALFALAVLASLAWRRPRAALGAGALSLSLALSLLAFRALCFGHLLPLSYYAKAGGLTDGLRYGARAFLLATGGVGAVLCVLAFVHGRRDDRALGYALVAHLLAVTLSGGDWMPGVRLFVPVLPLYARLAAVGALRFGHAFALVLLLLSCALPAFDLVTRMPQLRAAGESRTLAGARIARVLRQRAKRVALVDIGWLGYRSGVEVIDLGGITDPEIARLPGGHLDKHIGSALLSQRDPDALLLHSASPPRVADDGRLVGFDGYPVEQRVAASRWVRRHFVVREVFRYAPRYYYVLLERDGH